MAANICKTHAVPRFSTSEFYSESEILCKYKDKQGKVQEREKGFDLSYHLGRIAAPTFA